MQNPKEMKRNFSLKIGMGEDMVVEDVMVVEVTKITTSTEDSQANKTGVAEDVARKVVGRITTISNVTNITNRSTMQKIATPTVATTVVKWDILQKTVDPEER